VPRHLQQIGQESFGQSVATDDVFGDLATLNRKQDLLAWAVLDQAVALHALERRGYGRGCDVEPFGKSRSDHWIPVAGQVMQNLQVVLDYRRRRLGSVNDLPTLHGGKYRAQCAIVPRFALDSWAVSAILIGLGGIRPPLRGYLAKLFLLSQESQRSERSDADEFEVVTAAWDDAAESQGG
jgi:hypothetical protein